MLFGVGVGGGKGGEVKFYTLKKAAMGGGVRIDPQKHEKGKGFKVLMLQGITAMSYGKPPVNLHTMKFEEKGGGVK